MNHSGSTVDPLDHVLMEVAHNRPLPAQPALTLVNRHVTLSAFLNGRSDLSGLMALRIEKAFGVKMDTLMRMQSTYDIARTRKREGELMVAPYRPSPDSGTSAAD